MRMRSATLAACKQRRSMRSVSAGPFARILVGYVPTEQGADARALGVELAAACGAEVLLVSVLTAVWVEAVGENRDPAVVAGGERDRAASALEQAAAELAGAPGIGGVQRRLEASSSPARGLHDMAASESVDLIVVGSSHRGPVGRVMLGSVGERLLSGAPCAVAVAQRGRAATKRRIMLIGVAFDGSPEARLALSIAHRFAARIGARLRVLMVIVPDQTPRLPPPTAAPAKADDQQSSTPAHAHCVADHPRQARAQSCGPRGSHECKQLDATTSSPLVRSTPERPAPARRSSRPSCAPAQQPGTTAPSRSAYRACSNT